VINIVAAIGIFLIVGNPPAKQSQHPASNPLLVQLENKVYRLTKPMEIARSGVVFDGHGATLQGAGAGVGLHVGALGNVTIKNVKIVGFATGLLSEGSTSLTLLNVTVLGGQEGTAAKDSTGFRLDKVSGSALQSVTAHACVHGAVLSGCSKVSIEKSDLSHNTLSGLRLTNSATCLVRDNIIAYIGESTAAGAGPICGIAIENGSNHNQILRNEVVQCKSVGIGIGLESGSPSTDNTLQANDVSWTDGDGFSIRSQPANKLIDNTVGHCQIGILLSSVSDTLLKGNLVVGNTQYGIEDDMGLKSNYDSNAFAMDTGSPIAIFFKGSPTQAAATRVFQNIFIDYSKPLKIENTNPMTLQSNLFAGSPSIEIEDVADIIGKKPVVLNSQNDKPKSGPFLPSAGILAALPTIYDHLSGVSVSSLVKPASEVVVEGSLTGAFLGEEEVLARYKGELPIDITFPPRTVTAVRIKGVPQSPSSYLILLGDQSLAKNRQAEDDVDTIAVPNESVDGDTRSPDHGWKPKHGKAGEWWAVDLKEESTLTTFTILPNLKDPNGFWNKFRILVSTTGEFHGEETTVVTETNWSQKPGPLRTYKIAPTVGRYIRIIGDVDQEGVQLVQFGAYGLSH